MAPPQISDTPTMRPPHLEFVYRVEADMARDPITVGAPFGAGSVRVIMNILGGTLRGPGLSGEILEHGGADWGISIKGTNFMRLDARYTIRMSTGEHIFLSASGIYTPPRPDGPGEQPPFDLDNPDMGQNDLEWFTSIKIEAGEGRYNWLNSCVLVGALKMVDRRIIIEAWRLTNFPGRDPISIKAVM
ncbi:hypothetical protein PVAG01_03218 [Phlyctema vagabunda]|uniref:Uncharacterized protein n=1 Tax=Phlyctema vagabunda TaxID=108571 RepID=A0ABR4PTF7_9HELO